MKLLMLLLGFICQGISYTSGNINLIQGAKFYNNIEVVSDSGEISVKEGLASYLYIPIEAKTKTLIVVDDALKSDSDATGISVCYYDEEYKNIGGTELLIDELEIITTPDNAGYMSLCIRNNVDSDISMYQESAECVFVSADKNLDVSYTSINSAANKAADKTTLIVLPGTYKENVKIKDKEINIFGLDRKSCILENYTASYYSPPLEIAAGKVGNLTIISHGNGSDDKAGAYGVHIEQHFLSKRELIFDNCYIESDSNSGVGLGMRSDCKVSFNDCVLIGKEYGIFAHDSAYAKYAGLQELTFCNCTIEGKTGKGGMALDSQGQKDAKIIIKAYNNIVKGEIRVRNQGRKGTDDNFMGLYNYYLDPTSCGNNIEELNYKQKVE